MESHELDIEITPKGEVKLHVRGAKGHACMDYVKLLEQLVGPASEVQHTAEFYEAPTGVRIQIEQREKGAQG